VKVAVLAYTAVFIMPRHPYPEPPDRPQMATLRVTTSYETQHRVFDQPGTPPITLTTPNPEDLETVRRDIVAAKTLADVVVVSWHWGVSGGYRRRVPYQQEVGRACIDAGASIVVGHHPHMLQGIERYRDGLICYSLSNFVFWRFTDPSANHDPFTIIVDARLAKGGLRSASFIPLTYTDRWQPQLADADGARAVLECLRRESRELGTSLRLRDGRIELED
jgi:poly-gamma-glutamate synthesis protein (capsule biosynthesis protein)